MASNWACCMHQMLDKHQMLSYLPLQLLNLILHQHVTPASDHEPNPWELNMSNASPGHHLGFLLSKEDVVLCAKVLETKYRCCGLEKEKKMPPRIKVITCTLLVPLNLKKPTLSNYGLQSTDYKLKKHGNDVQVYRK
ncbi:unnamed protein product [Lactuca saligna]|uniref:Uncharacterized protein n=1 Tax=Lactuca saligna TaxID=75948 RepID=A0AA36E869_LACSI|nr:unnamed protein product [Lactuca saligna]